MRWMIVALALAAVMASGCATQTNTATTTDPAALVRERCTKCHSLDRIKNAQHDEAAWAATVARMKVKGAQVSDTEAAAIATFLAGNGGDTL